MKPQVLLSLVLIQLCSLVLSAQIVSEDNASSDPTPQIINIKNIQEVGFGFKVKFPFPMRVWSGIKKIYVTAIIEDSPAQKAGIVEGDKLIKIGKKEVKGLKVSEFKEIFDKEKSENGELPLLFIRNSSGTPYEILIHFINETDANKAGERNCCPAPRAINPSL